MAVEIDFSLPFDGCCNDCLAFDDFCSFWLFDRTIVFCFNAYVPLAMMGLQVATLVVSQELSVHEVAAVTE
jgi:hypothetical protein